MATEIKTIGVLTSGGDAPGMNAACFVAAPPGARPPPSAPSCVRRLCADIV